MSRKQITTPLLSFIIPTLNESAHIESVIRAIVDRVENMYEYEIIIVDNGSIDETVTKAANTGARVITRPNVTVGELRNVGAEYARGNIYVFIDGDVHIEDGWISNIGDVLIALANEPDTVTGSRCGISRHPTWIETYWFKPLTYEVANYINTGHLITTSALFHKIGGFDTTLETGEDYDYSRRARQAGARIINNPNLVVTHEGYPRTLKAFVRREMWHARGDFQSLASALGSKVGLLTINFLLLHILLIGFLFVSTANHYIVLVITGLIFSQSVLAALVKYRREPLKTIAMNAFLYYWYFFGRASALIHCLNSKRRLL